jgi:4'-phosphopantetheinyl transferase
MLSTSNSLEIWLAFYNDIDKESVQSLWRPLLSTEELKQESAFYFHEDRRRYVITRALVRKMLSKFAPVAPQDWIFTRNRYGRPEIDNKGTQVPALSFSISHTRSAVVVGVAHGIALGVDIENIHSSNVVPIDIAERYFAPCEVSDLLVTSAETQLHRFFEYWTLKESYIKARGIGLSIPLNRFGFVFAGQRMVKFFVDADLCDDANRWHFWQFKPSPEYLVGVCAEGSGNTVHKLMVNNVTTSLDECTCALSVDISKNCFN